MEILKKYGHKSSEMHRALNGFKNPIYVFKAFGSHWVPGTKGDLHIDAQGPEPWIEFSTIMYLNNESEYEGGIIYFPNQDFSYKPKQYSAVFFPGAGTEYIHGITTVTKGNRFTALYMHTSLPQNADPDFYNGIQPTKWEAQHYELRKH
jgi:predicted 2-oxoglutarate/Fe(II)-dependent dioxygenase YbiX